ncbi:dynamin family protein [Pasteurella sp. PK-2025]|uniref:dynamin family protein n=1 Tax=Pasteurella sp. PK-2025 TaxID=3413133 RepID=UPI003C730674
MDIIHLNDQIEQFVQKNNLSQDALTLKKEHAISRSDEWQKVLDELAETGRILRIGIIGRVKAGKSSLLNALLFNGQDILPKAATPMTAALTVMEYSESVRAEVEFFTEEDIEGIRKNYDRYNQHFEQEKIEKIKERTERALKKKKSILTPNPSLTDIEKSECETKAISILEREMKNSPYYASYDQYNRIKQSGKTLADLSEYQTINAASIEDLMSKLEDFVGSKGRFMPFTKAVKLYIPHEGLKELQIIDTPGINDPVTSRGLRTEEMLQHCDAVLVISPSGQFLSAEDTELLYRVTTQEGTQEAYLIASQVDNQLFGSERGNATDPADVLEKISTTLTAHARNVLQKQVERSPEMKVAAKKLSQHNVICTSSMAYAMKQRFNEKPTWDTSLTHVWKNLVTHYPEKFNQQDTALNTLNKLANIETVHGVFRDVNARKKEILQTRGMEFKKAKKTALTAYLEGLNAFITNRIQQIENTDIAELKQQKQAIEKQRDRIEIELGEVYDDLIFKIKVSLRKQMKNTLNEQIETCQDKADRAQKTESRSERYLYKKAPWYTRLWADDEYRTRYYDVDTVNATTVRRAISNARSHLGNELNDTALSFQKDWKKEFYHNILRKLREIMGDDALDVLLIKRTLLNILATIPEPTFKFTNEIPATLKRSGKLEKDEAEEFNKEAENYIETLKYEASSDIDLYIATYILSLKNANLTDNIVGDLENNLKSLIDDIENQEASLFYYDQLKNELAQLKNELAQLK